MPCNCVLDLPKYPQNEEWGPLVWRILHTFAERGGRQTNNITQGDEQRAWPLFIKTLPPVIPCPFCRDHLEDYLKKNPFQLPPDYTSWNEFLQTYFYDLHESVNVRLGKPSYPTNQLSAEYKDIGQLKDVLTRLTAIEERAIKMNGVSLFHWRAWLKQFNLLRAAIS